MRYSPNVSGTVSPRPARADPGNSTKEKKMQIHFYTTSADISSEIATLKVRQSELLQGLGKFWADNDNDAYSIVRPESVRADEAEYEAITEELVFLKAELEKVTGREAWRAQQRAQAEEQQRRASFAQQEAAVAAADPEQLWGAVNANRMESGCPALSKAFIGSAHVRRLAMSFGLFAGAHA